MTFINRMIKQAKADPQPTEFEIRPNQVSALADHFLGCNAIQPTEEMRERVQNEIRAGHLKMLGVPVRVLAHR